MTAAEVQALLERARQSIDAANDLVACGFFHFGASRAYYAMFYSAQALLLTRGKSFSRHSAVIAAFGREFAKPCLLDPKFHLYIRKALDVRKLPITRQPAQLRSKPPSKPSLGQRSSSRLRRLFYARRNPNDRAYLGRQI